MESHNQVTSEEGESQSHKSAMSCAHCLPNLSAILDLPYVKKNNLPNFFLK
jgi:hypothetical protein